MKLYTISTIITIGLAFVHSHGLSDEAATEKFLAEEGYTEISTTGTRSFGCGREDTYKTGFKAKNPRGIPTEGVVCKSLMGDAYIRR